MKTDEEIVKEFGEVKRENERKIEDKILEDFRSKFGDSAPRVAMRSFTDCDDMEKWILEVIKMAKEDERKKTIKEAIECLPRIAKEPQYGIAIESMRGYRSLVVSRLATLINNK